MNFIRKIGKFIRTWILIFAILAGIGSYFLYVSIPALDGTHAAMLGVIEVVQPLLIFRHAFRDILQG